MENTYSERCQELIQQGPEIMMNMVLQDFSKQLQEMKETSQKQNT